MDKIFFCNGEGLAKYLIKNGCTNIKSYSNGHTYAFIQDDNLIQLINKWNFEKKKYFF